MPPQSSLHNFIRAKDATKKVNNNNNNSSNNNNNNAKAKKAEENEQKREKELRNMQRAIAKYNIQLADPTPFAGNPSNIRAQAAEGLNMSDWEEVQTGNNSNFQQRVAEQKKQQAMNLLPTTERFAATFGEDTNAIMNEENPSMPSVAPPLPKTPRPPVPKRPLPKAPGSNANNKLRAALQNKGINPNNVMGGKRKTHRKHKTMRKQRKQRTRRQR